MKLTEAPSFRGFPLYDADLQAKGFPPDVTALADAIRAADAVIIITPEYNYSIPGALKNAIDWVSRLPDQPFKEKPVAIQSATGGPLGGARMQYHLRQAMIFLNAFSFGTHAVVGHGDVPASLESAGGPMAGICLRREHPMVLWNGCCGADCEQTGFLSRRRGYPIADGRLSVRPVMSGSTSSGPGPNYEIDAMGQSTKSLRDSPLRGTSAATSSAQPVRTHPGTLH